MRRADREVKDDVRIAEIIDKCDCCRVGFCDDGEVYIVPMNFGYEATECGYRFYFHGAKNGRKMDIVRKNPKVGFELDTNYSLKRGDIACNFSTFYQSVIGNGVICEVEDNEEKKHALELIFEHAVGGNFFPVFDDEKLNAVAVLRLDVEKISCKEHSDV